MERGFHGLTLGALSASGDPAFSERFQPLVPGFSRVPFGDLDALEAALRTEDVALFVVEPVVGHGVFLPPPGYLEGAQELCRRYGTLFCLDEVQTGFGRTGRLFALEHWGLEPDILALAKSLSGGYVPVGATLFRAELFDAVFDSLEHSMSHGSTFQPNDLAMVAGLATLHELDAQRLVERSARTGELLLERTRPLVERYDVVKDVRGLGLMWAIELGEPEKGGRTYRLLERMQPALFSQLVVVPLFTDHRVLSQVAGHGLNVIKGLAAARPLRGGRRLVRDGARRDPRGSAEAAEGDRALRAASRPRDDPPSPPEAPSESGARSRRGRRGPTRRRRRRPSSSPRSAR